ncbi:ankyrin repeat domain-containing protein, partial [bacterium]
SAAAHGKLDVLRELLDRDPESVNAPGGDGERPIHFAKTLEVAELLIERGADLEIRDIDHEGTPLQYQVNNRDVARALLRHGAKGDIFTAAALDDVDLLKRLLAEDPGALSAHVGQAPFITTASEGGHIYLYRLGGGKSPHQVAAERKSLNVLRELEKIGSPGQNLVAAAWTEDAEALSRIMSANPGLTIGPEDSKALASAAQDGRAETVRMLLEAGADPLVTGMDRGTPLHIACWFGHLPVVKLLLDRVPIDLRDASHGSTPLGWATHGSQFCRNDKGDYVGVVRALLAAGADIEAPANSANTSLLVQAGDREDVKEVLRSAGVKA